MDKRVSIIKNILKNPTSALKKISLEGENYFYGALVILILAPLITIIFTPKLSNYGSIILSLLGYFFLISILFFMGKLFQGKAKFRGYFSALTYSRIPSVIGAFFGALAIRFSSAYDTLVTINSIADVSYTANQSSTMVVNQLTSSLVTPQFFLVIFILFLLYAWSFVLSIIAYKESNKFSTGKAIGIIILSYVVLIIMIIFLIGLLSFLV